MNLWKAIFIVLMFTISIVHAQNICAVDASQQLAIDYRECISGQQIDEILRQRGSPAFGTGNYFVERGKAYNIDPRIALAFFQKESTFGTAGVATKTRSIGNLRPNSDRNCAFIYDAGSKGTYCGFNTWQDGIEAWYASINSNIYRGSGLNTVDTIVPTYAPASDNNDVQTYIRQVKEFVSKYSGFVLQNPVVDYNPALPANQQYVQLAEKNIEDISKTALQFTVNSYRGIDSRLDILINNAVSMSNYYNNNDINSAQNIYANSVQVQQQITDPRLTQIAQAIMDLSGSFLETMRAKNSPSLSDAQILTAESYKRSLSGISRLAYAGNQAALGNNANAYASNINPSQINTLQNAYDYGVDLANSLKASSIVINPITNQPLINQPIINQPTVNPNGAIFNTPSYQATVNPNGQTGYVNSLPGTTYTTLSTPTPNSNDILPLLLLANNQNRPAYNTGPASWEDPDAIERPKAKSPNTYLCDKISKVKITGSVPELVEANTQITITGTVNKFSTTCDGMAYQCRGTKVLQCTQSNTLLKIELKAPNCPASHPKILETHGEKSVMNWVMLMTLMQMMSQGSGASNLPASSSQTIGTPISGASNPVPPPTITPQTSGTSNLAESNTPSSPTTITPQTSGAPAETTSPSSIGTSDVNELISNAGSSTIESLQQKYGFTLEGKPDQPTEHKLQVLDVAAAKTVAKYPDLLKGVHIVIYSDKILYQQATEGKHNHPISSDIICLANTDSEKKEVLISTDNYDGRSDQDAVFTYAHEFGHLLGYDEAGADNFASEVLGYPKSYHRQSCACQNGVCPTDTSSIYPEALTTYKSSNFNDRTKEINAIVLHATAGSTLSGALSTLVYGTKVSAHYIIDKDGSVYNLVPENKIAWHAAPASLYGETGVNSFSIGIEIVNTGSEPYTDAQYTSITNLVNYLSQKYTIQPQRIVGHSDVEAGNPDPCNLDWSRIPVNGHNEASCNTRYKNALTGAFLSFTGMATSQDLESKFGANVDGDGDEHQLDIIDYGLGKLAVKYPDVIKGRHITIKNNHEDYVNLLVSEGDDPEAARNSDAYTNGRTGHIVMSGLAFKNGDDKAAFILLHEFGHVVTGVTDEQQDVADKFAYEILGDAAIAGSQAQPGYIEPSSTEPYNTASVPTTGTTPSGISSGLPSSSGTSSLGGTTSNTGTSSLGGTSTSSKGPNPAALFLLAALLQEQVNPQDCYRVCGKEYWTDIENVCVPQPKCESEDKVIKQNDCAYGCKEVECGAFENADLEIVVKSDKGTVTNTYETKTDSKGRYSFTFKTPNADGQYAVVINVIKNWDSGLPAPSATNSTIVLKNA